MWATFIFFGLPSYSYFIEGDDYLDCRKILMKEYGRDGIVIDGVSDYYIGETLKGMCKIFNITEEVFNNPPDNNIIYYLRAKVEIPPTLRSRDGEFCKVCKEFYRMAIGNQSDGSLVCWVCRDGNRWKYK
jgi:hypothetical protein